MKTKDKHYLGIDLHKRSATWVLISEEGETIWKRTSETTIRAIESTLHLLPVPPSSIDAVVEPVCGWRWFLDILEEKGCNQVNISNPLRTRLIADSKIKTDSIDATSLAQLLRTGYLPLSYKASQDIAHLL